MTSSGQTDSLWYPAKGRLVFARAFWGQFAVAPTKPRGWKRR